MADPKGSELATAYVFSLNGAHLDVLPRFSGIVRCIMTARRGTYRVNLTIIEDGSERDVSLPYALAFDMHAELERVAQKRRLRCNCPTSQSAAMMLCFELGRLHGALRPRDRVIILCFDPIVEAEMHGRGGVVVVNPEAMKDTDEFWREREQKLLQRLTIMAPPDTHPPTEQQLEPDSPKAPQPELESPKALPPPQQPELESPKAPPPPQQPELESPKAPPPQQPEPESANASPPSQSSGGPQPTLDPPTKRVDVPCGELVTENDEGGDEKTADDVIEKVLAHVVLAEKLATSSVHRGETVSLMDL